VEEVLLRLRLWSDVLLTADRHAWNICGGDIYTGGDGCSDGDNCNGDGCNGGGYEILDVVYGDQ
jgi:hypothetical protein